MKKKILLLIVMGTILSFVIYFYTQNNEITLVTLGDSLASGTTPYYIEGYSYGDYLKEYYKLKHELKNYYEFAYPHISLKELIYKIKENNSLIIKGKKVNIKQALNEADILIISVGIDEITSKKVTNEVRKEFKNDFEELLSMLKMLNNNHVLVLSLYKTKGLDALNLMKLNAIIKDTTMSNDFQFIDINNIIEESYFLNKENHFLNYEAHKKITELIKEELKK